MIVAKSGQDFPATLLDFFLVVIILELISSLNKSETVLNTSTMLSAAYLCDSIAFKLILRPLISPSLPTLRLLKNS